MDHRVRPASARQWVYGFAWWHGSNRLRDLLHRRSDPRQPLSG